MAKDRRINKCRKKSSRHTPRAVRPRSASGQNTTVIYAPILRSMSIHKEYKPRNTQNTRKKKEMDIVYKDDSYRIKGACFEVYYPKVEYELIVI